MCGAVEPGWLLERSSLGCPRRPGLDSHYVFIRLPLLSAPQSEAAPPGQERVGARRAMRSLCVAQSWEPVVSRPSRAAE